MLAWHAAICDDPMFQSGIEKRWRRRIQRIKIEVRCYELAPRQTDSPSGRLNNVILMADDKPPIKLLLLPSPSPSPG